MKSTIVSILQQRMDKCTTEMFWAVAAITGFCAIIITQKSSLLNAMPLWILIASTAIIVFYGIFYILHRHATYYLNAQDLVSLIRDFPECPERIKREPAPWRLRSLIGSGFYVLWVLGAGIVSISTLF